ncbi:MAG TPA: hypothetical protein VEU55_08620 [Gemmatimonadales bacterium]|nr:hypothetical protein [Gemmatimonadales bacterium]
MLASLQQGLIDQARPLLAGFTWILDWEKLVLGFAVTGDSVAMVVAKGVLILLPCALLVAAMWCTMLAVYSIPFRLARTTSLLTALLMSWWDAGRMVWFYWAGLVRFVLVVIGWIWGLLKLGGSLVVRLIKFIFTRPLVLLDWATRQYFQPGVPWLAFIFILFWSALEATIFTFTLRPTISEVLADLTGAELSGWAVSIILWPFLFILISGSFAAIQALSDAIKSRNVTQIVSMALVEGFVMFFEVMFLYRELIDAITPWIASQTGFQLGFFSTLALASFGWIGVRAMTWFLFGRFGTPALLGILARQNIAGAGGGGPAVAAIEPDFWKGPIQALKAEAEWFKKEAREVFELISLPVLQILAAAVNFAVVVVLGHPSFTLPFRSLDQLLASTPLLTASGKHAVPGGAA